MEGDSLIGSISHGEEIRECCTMKALGMPETQSFKVKIGMQLTEQRKFYEGTQQHQGM